MRIVIDLQGAQTESRVRGIGRYSLSLALAMARNAREHEIWLALSNAFPDVILDIRAAFSGLIPSERIRVFQVPTPVSEMNPANAWRARAAEKLREHFLMQLQPDVVLISSLFEGYIDDAVTSVGSFAPGEQTAVVLYDLIPLMNQAQYLPNASHRDHYFRKVESLKKSGLLLAISESARQEAIDVLGLPSERIVNISTAADDIFGSIDLTEDQIEQLRSRYRIARKMVMYSPGGFDVRKNCDGLIKAYACLPATLRAEHQLVIVSKISGEDRLSLRAQQKAVGLADDELLLTGYVSDPDLIALYNLATLFVFPSKHEGFGLPALEAMACGTPTIGSNTSSIPEVIGWSAALFDPAAPQSIANKMERALCNETFRDTLCEHAKSQAAKFSWDTTARLALDALTSLHERRPQLQQSSTAKAVLPKLAFISPLPPERSGISVYSAELLPALAKHYDIDVVVSQAKVIDPWVLANLHIRTVAWFRAHASDFDRVLYQFGNSPFHSHMFDLLREHPGVVVLHDFFLSGVLANDEVQVGIPNVWSQALYDSHGYMALKERFAENGLEAAKRKYPVNLDVLQQARALIFHSDYSRSLVELWYSQLAPKVSTVIPLCRSQAAFADRNSARRALKLAEDYFVVCSFGFLDLTKLNHRLLGAWLKSSLFSNLNCVLLFVGENNSGKYGESLIKTIEESGIANRIRITEWVDQDTFRQYLAAADVAVQLRCNSRGETSAAVLDCMNNGIPTIVNANGSMGDLAQDAVLMLPDEFAEEDLIAALDSIYHDAELRKCLTQRAQEVIQNQHSPETCAVKYAEAIESAYADRSTDTKGLITDIAGQPPSGSESELLAVSQAVAGSIAQQPALRQLFVDVTNIAQNDLKSGIERVVRAQMLELLKNPPIGYRIEPVRLSNQGGQWRYWYACRYTCKTLGITQSVLADRPVDASLGDILFVADYAPHMVIEAAKAGIFRKLKAQGVSVNFQVYDLLPILSAKFFPEGAASAHANWLKAICDSATALVCISDSVELELREWMTTHIISAKNQPNVMTVRLGADIEASAPTLGLPDESASVLAAIAASPCFLMVGTIEPRKGHLQALVAFERLWAQGVDANLVVVGREGWKSLPDSQRKTIPKTVSLMTDHPELNKRLFWFKDISDEYLERIYAVSSCLLAASEGEGFGLPLIEAAQHGVPIIARDIPVFRELAGDHAFYFSADDDDQMAQAIRNWIDLYNERRVPLSKKMSFHTWKQNVDALLMVCIDGNVKK